MFTPPKFMKYIISIIPVGYQFTYSIESESQYSQNAGPMAKIGLSNSFLPTGEIAISKAKNQLRKAGVKDEDIILY